MTVDIISSRAVQLYDPKTSPAHLALDRRIDVEVTKMPGTYEELLAGWEGTATALALQQRLDQDLASERIQEIIEGFVVEELSDGDPVEDFYQYYADRPRPRRPRPAPEVKLDYMVNYDEPEAPSWADADASCLFKDTETPTEIVNTFEVDKGFWVEKDKGGFFRRTKLFLHLVIKAFKKAYLED